MSEDNKPDPVVGKSMLDEFLDEWNEWRGNSKAKQQQKIDAKIDALHDDGPPDLDKLFKNHRDKKEKKDSVVGEMLFGLILLIAEGVGWLSARVADLVLILFGMFKYFIIIGAAIYFLTDFSFNFEVTEGDKETLQNGAEQVEEKFMESLKKLEESFDGLQIKIKKTDGTVIEHTFGQDETPPPLLPDPKEIGQ